MKRIGLIALALVIALGSIGVGYAMWTDTIYIDGNVETGNLDINVEYVSGCVIYKIVDTGDIVSYYEVINPDNGQVVHTVNTAPDGSANNLVVATATAALVADDMVQMDFVGAFPTLYEGGAYGLYADIIAHYAGSVPAHVTYVFSADDAKMQWLWDNGFLDLYVFRTDVTIAGDGTIDYTVNSLIAPRQEIQMHFCEYIKINVYLDLPQPEDLVDTIYTQEDFMNLTTGFEIKLVATQWNE
jgi:hypothetical protein